MDIRLTRHGDQPPEERRHIPFALVIGVDMEEEDMRIEVLEPEGDEDFVAEVGAYYKDFFTEHPNYRMALWFNEAGQELLRRKAAGNETPEDISDL